MTKQPLTPECALEKAERLCAKTEYAVFEIQTVGHWQGRFNVDNQQIAEK